MKTKTHIFLAFLCLAFALIGTACNKKAEKIDAYPTIEPDYGFCLLPYNIAPCNFNIPSSAQAYKISLVLKGKEVYKKRGKKTVQFPLKKWQNCLKEAKGDTLWLCLQLKEQGNWKEYKALPIYIDSVAISSYLTYRLIEPSYQLCNYLVIEERCLENFKTRNLFDNVLNGMACVNCHTSAYGDPNYSVYHVRFQRSGTYINYNGKIKRVDLKSNVFSQGGVYPAWHPSKRYIAFGTAQAYPFVHSQDIARRTEVFDSLGDIMVYDIVKNRIVSDSRIASLENEETFPAFSPDGKLIYFCRSITPQKDSTEEDPVDYSKKIHYSLMSIEFLPDKDSAFGKMEMLLDAQAIGKTVSFPRISPNGKHLVFCLSNHGTFPIRHPESDLYIMNLESKEYGILKGVNSNKTESYHEFSPIGNGWMVFSSKRSNGMYSRPYFCKITEGGEASKPFLLPQKNPDFYLNCLKSFNVPVFSNDKAPYNAHKTAEACLGEVVYPEKISVK